MPVAGLLSKKRLRWSVLDVDLDADVTPLTLQQRLHGFAVRALRLRAEIELQALSVLHANAVRPDLPPIGVEDLPRFVRVVRMVFEIVRVRPREHGTLVRFRERSETVADLVR